MRREDVKVAVVVIEGSNSEAETASAFRSLGAQAEIVHLKQFLRMDTTPDEERSLLDYQALVIPGGFSGGDYIRAGAIFAARMKSRLEKDLDAFVSEGRPVLGICNGFQVLVELGMLPDLGHQHVTKRPEAVLHLNGSDRYECRPTRIKHTGNGSSLLTKNMQTGEVRFVPSAHGEGRLILATEAAEKRVQALRDDGQVVFTYTDEDGADDVPYPLNPNGSPGGVAGVTNPEGNVLGLMPHPERSFWRWQHPDWTRSPTFPTDETPFGDGQVVLEGVLQYAERTL
jgi:phosphoribosylformylglycinamidine synthase subunit PurQ / glutaminase